MELISNIVNGGSGDFNPGLGEETAGSNNEDHIEDSVDGISDNLKSGSGWADIINESSNWDWLRSSQLYILPSSEEINKEVSAEVSV